MSTLGSLLLALGQSTPAPYGDIQAQTAATRRQEVGTETDLLKLADLKRQQEAEAQVIQAIQQNPELARHLFGGGPVLGALGQPSPGAGGGPMTQQAFGPGGTSPAQVIPGGQDLSQFATQGTPQSTLASLGPQPQAPQNPLLAMAQRNPQVALLLQRQMQAQEDRRVKMQEQQLDMGVKVSEAVARQLQGVTDQASLDEARERIRLIHPQAAAQIPQFYSKEAVESLQQRGIAVADVARWRKDMATARQTEVTTAHLPKVFGALEQFATGGTPAAAETTPTTTGPAGPGQGTTPVPAPAQAPTGAVDKARWDGLLTLLDQTADQEGVPRDLVRAVVKQESNWDINAEGDGGKAKGWFQLHEGASKDAGIDPAQRHVPELNIRGGIRYLALKYKQAGGDWDKALALYNGGGDPHYVANVRRHLPSAQGTATTGGTGTAQAPKADARVAQLQARIDQGNKAALQAEMVGMEGPARQIRAQVAQLEAEKIRLDAPMQDFLKKQAVQGLELQQQREQGLAAAQVKADTEPASKEEIDAVNRGVPPDKRVPYGTTRKQLREQGRVGAEPIAPKILEDLTNTTTAIQQFEELSNAVTALPTGPLTQYVEGFKERWGIDISDEKVAQRAILQGATNQLLQARSGAAISEGEYQRLLKELPNEGLDPKVFKARLANTVRQFKNLYKTKVQILRKTGHAIPDDLMEPLPAPEGSPAPKVSTNVDKFKDALPK